MKKIFAVMILIILLAALTTAQISKVSTDTEQKLKSYADSNLKDSLKYSNFEIMKIEKFEDYTIIYFKSDGKEQRWFKQTENFNEITK